MQIKVNKIDSQLAKKCAVALSLSQDHTHTGILVTSTPLQLIHNATYSHRVFTNNYLGSPLQFPFRALSALSWPFHAIPPF